MSPALRGAGRQYWVALRSMIVLTVVVGIAYPLIMTGVAQLTMPAQANGSTITNDGHVVGSSLIGQSFATAKGTPIARWFQSRPSAAGTGYDAESSSGSNLGPNNPDLVKTIRERQATIAALDRVPVSQIPADAVTASGSGLDPQISPDYALIQVKAVAQARGLDTAVVEKLVRGHIQQRDLGFLGEPTVNVLQLNLALAKMDPSGK